MAATKEHRRAIVVGSGFGGIAAAVRLAARGWEVTVLERSDRAGGRARVVEQDGFRFDSGPTLVTAPFLLEELWNAAGARFRDDVALLPLRPFYRVHLPDRTVFDYVGDAEKMREEVRRLAPRDVSGYERFLATSERIAGVAFRTLAQRPLSEWRAMLDVVPELAHVGAQRSVYSLVSRFVKNDELRRILSFHSLLVGGSPFEATAMYGLVPYLERAWGVHTPRGGMGALVAAMVALAERRGVVFRYGAAVDRVLVEEGRARGVRLEGGETLRASVVVSNVDPIATYRRMVPREHRRRFGDRRLGRARQSPGAFVWCFGTSRTYDTIPQNSVLLSARYEAQLADVFARRRLTDDFSVYLHRATASAPELAPPGHDAFQAVTIVPDLDGKVDWSTRSEPYRRALLRHLERALLPGLSGAIVSSRVMNPTYFRDELGSERGSAFGLASTFFQSGYFRPHHASEDVPGLYFVGAGTHPGAGIPAVLVSARLVDGLVGDPR